MLYAEMAYFEGNFCRHCADWQKWKFDEIRRKRAIASLWR